MGRAHQAWRASLAQVSVLDLIATLPKRTRVANREELRAATAR
jgi:hypothetical protein